MSVDRPKLKTARLNVSQDVAMRILSEASLTFHDRRWPEGMTRPGISRHYEVPMAWVGVPYLEGCEAEVRATLTRIAPGAVLLGLDDLPGSACGTAAADSHLWSKSCLHEGGASPGSAVHSGSPSVPLSAAGSGESCEEVKVPCTEATGSAADTQTLAVALGLAMGKMRLLTSAPTDRLSAEAVAALESDPSIRDLVQMLRTIPLGAKGVWVLGFGDADQRVVVRDDLTDGKMAELVLKAGGYLVVVEPGSAAAGAVERWFANVGASLNPQPEASVTTDAA